MGAQYPWASALTPSREQFTRGERPDTTSSEHPSQVMTLTFNGGRNHALPPHMLNQGECWELENFYYPREAAIPQTRPGVTLHSPSRMPGRVVAMHQFQKSDTESYTVCACYSDDATHIELYYLDPDSNVPVLIGDLGTNNTAVPTFATFGSALIIAQSGEYLKEWQGNTKYYNTDTSTWVATGAGSKATGSITVSDNTKICEDLEGDDTDVLVDYVTIGNRTILFDVEEPTSMGTIKKGSTAAETATNITNSINRSSWDVSATVSGATITLTATRTGSEGNSLVLADGTGGGLTVVAMSGGVDGYALDTITTFRAPKPAIVANGKNQRLLATGSSGYVSAISTSGAVTLSTGDEDRLYFSSTGNAWSWEIGNYGGGEYADIGYGEGNAHSALCTFLDEIMVHKNGQSRDIYRVSTPDADTATWSASRRSLAVDTAALNPRCALSVSAKHLTLDSSCFRIHQGTDTYDEIASVVDGAKVYDILRSPRADSAFMVLNPNEMYVLVFPRVGQSCAVYHYGSRRWSTWSFDTDIQFWSAAYNAVDDLLLLGGDDGYVYKLDASVATDVTWRIVAGAEANYELVNVPFISRIIGPAIGSESAAKTIVLHSIFDYQTILDARGYLGIVRNRDDGDVKKLCDFTTLPTGSKFENDAGDDITSHFLGVDGSDVTPYLYSSAYGRKATMIQGDGEVIAPLIQITNGAVAANSHTMRVAIYGKAGR